MTHAVTGGVLIDAIPELRRSLAAAAEPERAPAMSAYMRGHFPFLGVTSPARTSAARPFLTAGGDREADELLDAADVLWSQPEREFQYVAVDLLRRWVRHLDAPHLDRIEQLILRKSWWDTIDGLAPNVVGPLVTARPELAEVMDDWIRDDDVWVARSAILHQLTFRDRTDTDRLFGYVDERAGDTEFFIRKACGWALRTYGRVEPDAVRSYVADRGDRLSGLTRREALKHL